MIIQVSVRGGRGRGRGGRGRGTRGGRGRGGRGGSRGGATTQDGYPYMVPNRLRVKRGVRKRVRVN